MDTMHTWSVCSGPVQPDTTSCIFEIALLCKLQIFATGLLRAALQSLGEIRWCRFLKRLVVRCAKRGVFGAVRADALRRGNPSGSCTAPATERPATASALLLREKSIRCPSMEDVGERLHDPFTTLPIEVAASRSLLQIGRRRISSVSDQSPLKASGC